MTSDPALFSMKTDVADRSAPRLDARAKGGLKRTQGDRSQGNGQHDAKLAGHRASNANGARNGQAEAAEQLRTIKTDSIWNPEQVSDSDDSLESFADVMTTAENDQSTVQTATVNITQPLASGGIATPVTDGKSGGGTAAAMISSEAPVRLSLPRLGGFPPMQHLSGRSALDSAAASEIAAYQNSDMELPELGIADQPPATVDVESGNDARTVVEQPNAMPVQAKVISQNAHVFFGPLPAALGPQGAGLSLPLRAETRPFNAAPRDFSVQSVAQRLESLAPQAVHMGSAEQPATSARDDRGAGQQTPDFTQQNKSDVSKAAASRAVADEPASASAAKDIDHLNAVPALGEAKLPKPVQQVQQTVLAAVDQVRQSGDAASTSTARPAPILRKLDIVLQPPDLGAVRINMAMGGKSIQVELVAQQSETAKLLREDQQHLKSGLTHAGFDSVNVVVAAVPVDASNNLSNLANGSGRDGAASSGSTFAGTPDNGNRARDGSPQGNSDPRGSMNGGTRDGMSGWRAPKDAQQRADTDQVYI